MIFELLFILGNLLPKSILLLITVFFTLMPWLLLELMSFYFIMFLSKNFYLDWFSLVFFISFIDSLLFLIVLKPRKDRACCIFGGVLLGWFWLLFCGCVYLNCALNLSLSS